MSEYGVVNEKEGKGRETGADEYVRCYPRLGTSRTARHKQERA